MLNFFSCCIEAADLSPDLSHCDEEKEGEDDSMDRTLQFTRSIVNEVEVLQNRDNTIEFVVEESHSQK
jgi:hypothetical protein